MIDEVVIDNLNIVHIQEVDNESIIDFYRLVYQIMAFAWTSEFCMACAIPFVGISR